MRGYYHYGRVSLTLHTPYALRQVERVRSRTVLVDAGSMPENHWSSDNVKGRRPFCEWFRFATRMGTDSSFSSSAGLERVPEKALWAACLVQAFVTENTTVFKQQSKRMLGKDRESWFFSDSKLPGSYLFICEVLDLDPKATYRKGMLLREVHKLTKRKKA